MAEITQLSNFFLVSLCALCVLHGERFIGAGGAIEEWILGEERGVLKQ